MKDGRKMMRAKEEEIESLLETSFGK